MKCRFKAARLDDPGKLNHSVSAADKQEHNARIIAQMLTSCENRIELVGAAKIAGIADHELVMKAPFLA